MMFRAIYMLVYTNKHYAKVPYGLRSSLRLTPLWNERRYVFFRYVCDLENTHENKNNEVAYDARYGTVAYALRMYGTCLSDCTVPYRTLFACTAWYGTISYGTVSVR